MANETKEQSLTSRSCFQDIFLYFQVFYDERLSFRSIFPHIKRKHIMHT